MKGIVGVLLAFCGLCCIASRLIFISQAPFLQVHVTVDWSRWAAIFDLIGIVLVLVGGIFLHGHIRRLGLK